MAELYVVVFFVAMSCVVFTLVLAIDCKDIKQRGSGADFDLEELGSLVKLTSQDLEECVMFLGSVSLSKPQASAIWAAIVQVYGSQSEIPEDILRQLGFIILGIPPNDFGNISLTDIDTISAFGNMKLLTMPQLLSLQKAIRDQWTGKETSDYTTYDLIALNRILCAFNSSALKKIPPTSYKGAAATLATLSNCSNETIGSLVYLAQDANAFGDPRSWSSTQIGNIGCVLSGLPLSTIKQIKSEAFEGLNAEMIKCLPPTVLQAMTEKQLLHFSPEAVDSLTQQQKAILSDPQRNALQEAISRITSSNKDSSSGVISACISRIVWLYFVIWVVFVCTLGCDDLSLI